MKRLFDLSSRRALVTGAGQGMGLGIVEALARQGAHVFLNDLYSARAEAEAERLRAAGLHVEAAPADITDPEARTAMLAAILGGDRVLDILVNNAGVPVGMPGRLRAFGEMTEADFDRQLDLNFRAVVALCHAVLPGMIRQAHGRILLISSESWRLGQSMGLSDYASAKAAGIGLMRTLSAETGRQGVTVNALSLGAMNNHGYDDVAARVTAVGRAGTPADVGAAAAYLVSDEASWVTGQTLALNGGSCTA